MKTEGLFEKIYTPVASLEGVVYTSPEPLDFEHRRDGSPLSVREGVRWAQNRFDCGWFCLRCTVPDDCADSHLVLLLDIGGEACAYTPDGVPHKGFTNVKSEFTIALGKPAKTVLWDVSPFRTGNDIEIWLDGGANDLFGNFIDGGVVKTLRLAVCDDDLRTLYYDAEVMTLADSTFASRFEGLDDGDLVGLGALVGEFYQKNGAFPFTVFAEGHSHIDLAWLWPIRETRRKALRTLSTVVYNSRLYKDFIFGVSQPQLLEWVKQDSPALYESLKSLHAEGRLKVRGGFFVECDANLPSGEALIRQAIYGMRFWRDEFGEVPDICWLPDTFGFNGQLPQIIAKTAGKYFLTTKLSWNDTNVFPYSTFIWRGIDGSEIISHIPPEGNYNSAASPASLAAIKDSKLKSPVPCALMLYGIGDGGGGPGMEHLERIAREGCLPSLPSLKNGTAEQLFAAAEEHRSSLPVWEGELYLEKHRGTYTTHRHVKQNNAECQRLLAAAEALFAIDAQNGTPIPRDELDDIWKRVLLLQFHDILPGSAIGRVYDEAAEEYARIKEKIYTLLPKGDGLFNATSFERCEYALREGKAVRLTALPFASAVVTEVEDKGVLCDKTQMENDLIKVCFDYDGAISSVFDKRSGCELLRDRAGIFTLYPDSENAWECAAHNEGGRPFELCELDYEEGVVSTLHMGYKLGENTLKCDVSLQKDSSRLDFEVTVSLADRDCCVRCAFPLNVFADTASCGIPFGSIDRPTHKRDSRAAAMREVCCQRFVDISDGEAGAAILSSDIYGYDVKNCVLDIQLVRNVTCPRDTVATDMGEHRLRFAFYAHHGDKKNDGVVREAYLFANPLLPGLRETPSIASVSSDSGSVVIETVKPCEDGKGMTVRLYESIGVESAAVLTLNPTAATGELYYADMLENVIGPVTQPIRLAPYEIVTIKVCRKAAQ